MLENVIRIVITANDRASKTFAKVDASLETFRKRLKGTSRDNDTISRMFNDMSRSASKMSSQLDKAGDSLRKFGLSGAVITLLPQLIVLLVQLGAQLIAVASSAGIAAAGLGAGLAAGAAQAVPAIGLLAIALKGLQNVMAAVKAVNNDTAKSSAGVSDAADKQRAANDALVAAQERVKEAQRKLTDARREARRELQDMVLDQEKARISAERADLSLERARQSARKASVTGNLSDLADATLDVKEGKVDRKQNRLDVSRGGKDLNKALASGVEGSDKVVSARKELADATKDLDKAQREAAKSTKAMTDGSNAATAALAKLTPAQKRLFDAIMSIKKVAKEAIGGATEAITDGFTHAVKKAEKVLENIKVQRAMNKLGASIRDGLKTVTNMVSGPEGQKIFAGLTEAAAQNIPHVAKAIGNLSIAFGRLAMAGRPFVEWMVKGFERWSEKVEKGSRNTKSLTHFFQEGQKHLKAWVNLLSSIVDLFLALGGSASSTGLKTVNDMSKSIRKTADNIKESKKETKQFWDTVYSLNGPMSRFFKSLGKMMIDVFKGGGAESFKNFSKLMSDVLVPAMTTVFKVIVQLTRIILKFLTLPFVSDIVKWGVVIVGLAFALAKFVAIMEVLGAIVRVVASAFGLLGAIVMAHPIVALIAALVVAIVLLEKKFHFLKPTLDWLMDALKWLGKGFLKLANIVGDAIGDMVRRIARGVKRIANWISDGPIGDAIRWWARVWRRMAHTVADVLGDIVSVIRRVGKRIGGLFSDIWGTVKSVTKNAFSWILKKLGDFWDKFTDVVKGAAGGVKKAFEVVAKGIKNIFVEIFKGIYSAVREVVNAIANGAAKIANLPGISSFAGGKIPRNPMPPYDKAFAEGGVVKAKPGGIKALIGEAGHDEVVLTTDPKHQNNTKRLLSMFLSKTGIMPEYAFAKGGYVQGARPPGSTTARMLANYMFEKGFNVTSAKDGRHAANSYHYKNGGSALDFGNSVNNLNSVWSVLAPMKAIFAELFGPKGLYHGSQKFSSPAIQAQHNDHVHVATGSISAGTIKKILLGVAKGIGDSVTGGAVSKLAPWIKKATKNFSGWVSGFIGDDPKDNKKIGPYRGLMHNIWGAYRKAIKKKLNEAKEKDSDNVDTSPASGGLISWLTKALKITHKYSPMNLRLLKGRALQESGGDPKAQNNWDSNAKAGHPSKGLLQTIDSTFNTYKMPGMNNIWNPIHNAVAAIRYMFARYGHIVGPSSTGYATGGELPGSEGSPINVLAHAGEMILNRSQQMALGGPARLRRMFGFNPRTGKFATGGEIGLPDSERKAGSKALRSLDDPVSEFTSDLSKASKSLLKAITGNKGTKAILKIIRQMTSDEGPIALLLDSLSTMRDQFSAFIKKRRFTTSEDNLSSEEAEKLNDIDDKIAREKKRKRPRKSRLNSLQKRREKILSQANVSETLTPSDQSELELDELEKEGSTLAGARSDVQADIDAIKKKLRAEKRKGKRKNKSKIRKYDAALNALEKSMNEVDSAIGDNLEARFQKQQEIIDNQITEIGERADKRNSAIDIKRRLSIALGQLGNIPGLINEQISSVGQQVAELRTTLENAKKLGDQKLVEKVQKQIDDLNTSIVEMTIEKINAAVTAINTSAERQTAVIDRAKRVASATGNKSAIPELLKSQLAVVREQAKSIEGQAWGAHVAGNEDLRTQLDAQKNELKTQAVELVAEIFNASIESVNSSAATSMSLIDTKSRMANIANLGRPDYASLGSLLSDKGGVLSTQKSELESLLSQAIAAGNEALTDSLNQSVLDLEAAISENTLAIEQNTVAALQFKIDNTNKSSSFLTGVADASSSIIKTIGEMMGEVDTGALLEYATSKGETLQSQGQSLKGYLDEFLGGTLGSSFTSATGTDLVDMVNKIVSSTDLSGMITEEVDQFYSLIDAILSNEQAVQDNTSAIEDLEGSMKQQTFTTTAWEKFRQAIFDGSGNLLSSYDIPQMATGGMIAKEGLFHLHAGEKVTPADEVNNLSGDTNINIAVNKAGGPIDADYLAKRMSWELYSRGRR